MELRNYFDFNSEIDIRIKGHRIAIQHVLNKYRQGKGVDELHHRFPTLSMEEIYATILYYLANKEEVEAYLEREKLMDEEAGKLIEMYGRTPTLINWEERLEEARQRLIAEGKYPVMPKPASEDAATPSVSDSRTRKLSL
ncbi:MAG: DUF433 domain-containing protein [Candidatus Poribacteria bacterium]|nr:DUF433 domain-containing protein [Candidatus Poribacteria bacterium]